MTQVFDWREEANSPQAVSQAVQALKQGHLVAFPTETVYGLAASAFMPQAVDLLTRSKGRPQAKPLTLAVRDADQALQWVPDMSPLGRRLARRCWPGPVTLVFTTDLEKGPLSQLPESIRQKVCPGGSVGLRVPAHQAILQALEMMGHPLVLSSANRSNQPPAVTAQEVIEAVGEDVALVIDSGPSYFGKASTVVRINSNQWEILREGVVSAEDLRAAAACKIVFVCTGNTCRSPMAEALCKKLLAERVGCRPEELPERGFLVLSAGVAAMMGSEAAPEAVEVVRELGGDLTGHSSRPLTMALVSEADYLITMTRGHQLVVTTHCARLNPNPRLISQDGTEILDPIGCGLEVYRECARQILRHLEGLLAELQPL